MNILLRWLAQQMDVHYGELERELALLVQTNETQAAIVTVVMIP